MMCSHNQTCGSYRIFSIFESFDHDVFSSTQAWAARVIQFFISFVNDCAPLPGRVAEEEDSDGGDEDEGHVDIPALLTQHPRRRGG